MWTLEDRLRKAREVTGLGQSEFAAEIDVSRRTVGNYESGSVAPRRIVLKAWALRSGVPLEWLETGSVTHESPSPGGDGLSVECAPRDSNPEPIDYGSVSNVVPLGGRPAHDATRWAVAA